MENIMNMIIYRKTLNFSLVNSKKYDVGKLVNFMQSDSSKLIDFPTYFFMVITLPLQIAIAIYLMYNAIGFSFLAGFGAIILTFFFNLFISKYEVLAQTKILEKKDERIKLSNEIISSIKLIKVHSWENYFLEKISDLRKKEIYWVKNLFYVNFSIIFSLYSAPMLILSSTFIMYSLTDNPMTPQNVFTLVSTFVIVQEPIRSLPMAIANVISTNVSLKRIQEFLLAEEIDSDYINLNVEKIGENAIKLINGYFYWDQENEENENNKILLTEEAVIESKKDIAENILEDKIIQQHINGNLKEVHMVPNSNAKYILQNLNIEIKKGSLTAIIGG